MKKEERTAEWNEPGGALSDKSARTKFGLTQEEIVKAIETNKLQYRINNAHGNPYFRLLRREVEMLVVSKQGSLILKRSIFKTSQTKPTKSSGSLKEK